MCKRLTDLRISQYPEGPATGHLDTGFSWFSWVQERMLRWFPPFQVASTRFSCSPTDLNSVVSNCLLSYYVKRRLPLGDNPTAVNKYYYCYMVFNFQRKKSLFCILRVLPEYGPVWLKLLVALARCLLFGLDCTMSFLSNISTTVHNLIPQWDI
jgi:hypothetical protein